MSGVRFPAALPSRPAAWCRGCEFTMSKIKYIGIYDAGCIRGQQINRHFQSSNKRELRARMRSSWNARRNRRRFIGDSEWAIKNIETREVEAL